MTNKTTIIPSPEARQLFGKMVARSHDNHVSLGDTIALSVDLCKKGSDPKAIAEVAELIGEGWLACAPDGGWIVDR